MDQAGGNAGLCGPDGCRAPRSLTRQHSRPYNERRVQNRAFKTEVAVCRITHLPTGTVVECQDERSQHKNKDKAMKVLRARLYDAEKAKHDAAIAGERKSQVGTGDRSERIRTYNYPQGRVTDHRINLTLYRLEQILNGDLDELIDALITADTAAKLSAAEE